MMRKIVEPDSHMYGYWELLDLDFGPRCVFAVRFAPWHLVWAGLVGRYAFHGQLGAEQHAAGAVVDGEVVKAGRERL